MVKRQKQIEPAEFGANIRVFGGGIKTLDGSPTVDDVESEMTVMPHLDNDRRIEVQGTSRSARDARQVGCAAQAINRIPNPTEAFHVVVSGKFSLWDVVPTILSFAQPATIENLHIATLGFSKTNIAELCELIDTRRVERASLLCSHYFKGTSTTIYDFAAAAFATRPHTRFLSVRTHAKILAMKLTDGRRVVVESSANLRSCKNIEQLTIIGEPKVYDFHRGWIDSIFGVDK